VYRGFGKVAPAPLRGTIGKVVVEVVVGVVGLPVVVVEEDTVVVEVFVVVVVAIVVEVVVGLLVVVVVVLLLHALKTELAISSNDVKTTSHFLLNLLDKITFLLSLISFII
jgi:hypothetical protein